MNQKRMITVSVLAMVWLLNGCNTPDIPMVNTDNTNECIRIDKNLVKVDQFVATVSGMSISQAEEYIVAVPSYDITHSSVKPRMLKDANKRKNELMAERQQLGCSSASQE
jgi:hypothetical protein